MGKLYGIGVGPGDPELLTLKAYKILNQADVIFCPEKKKGAGSFAFDIIKEHIKDSKAQIVNLEYPMHYKGDELKKMWEENGRLISEYLKGDKTGAFITLGDPSVYSTFMYTLPYIEAFGTETEVVPGIPSFCAVSAKLGDSLVDRSEQLHVIPSTYDIEDGLKLPGTKVLMKAASKMPIVKETLKRNDLKGAMIENCGMPEEHIYHGVDEIPDQASYYSIIVVKEDHHD